MSGGLEELAELLHGIDMKGYGAYKRCRGAWHGEAFTLHVEHVQGDPYATPSKVRLQLPAEAHGIPDEAWETRPRRLGLCDCLLRIFADACADLPRVPGSGKSGRVQVSVDTPMVLERAGCSLDDEGLHLRFRVGLPAKGRRCLGHSAAALLTEYLPRALEAVRWERLDTERAWHSIRVTEDHAHLQELLVDRGLVAFVREGSVLPRESGVSWAPLPDAVPFRAPEELRVTLPTLHHGEVTGLGVPPGVTVVTGGGFHGKTTLLEALQFGVFPHVPGDGREWTVTVPDAVKVRSEDGRHVAGVDLRPFIRDLPLGRGTARFTTPDASGSTSLAADVMEALEAGTSLLLLDEDTCATNLMVRDARMQALITEEPITPLIDRVGELAAMGVSVVLVTGGSGDYLDVADTVILMEDYRPRDVTRRAREVAERRPTGRDTGRLDHPLRPTPRAPRPEGFDPRKRSGKVRIRTRGTDAIQFGTQDLDLSAVEQLVDYGQARTVAGLMWKLERAADGRRPLRELVEEAVERARRDGLGWVEASPELALPRPQELAKAVSRLRSLVVEAATDQEPDEVAAPGAGGR